MKAFLLVCMFFVFAAVTSADSVIFTFVSGPSNDPTAITASFELSQNAMPPFVLQTPAGPGLAQYTFGWPVLAVNVPAGICDCGIFFGQVPQNSPKGLSIVQSAGISCPQVGGTCPYADGTLFAVSNATLFNFSGSGSSFALEFNPGSYPFLWETNIGTLNIAVDTPEPSTFILVLMTFGTLILARILLRLAA